SAKFRGIASARAAQKSEDEHDHDFKLLVAGNCLECREVVCDMPIYEFACPKCRVVFNFLSKRLNPDRTPVCPKCGNKKMARQMSSFATPRGGKEPLADSEGEPGDAA